ncbi:NAD(P)-dependent alcohol dehydrogenase [Pseudomonas sp. GD03860]|uniref:NAD(P)-dependent alcohol dehydrogenase n=1 Tax=Pseudomonas TaxID=286 RepID=UPI0023638B5D|nr:MULTISPECIES: NAD(P)-dependent alcohol dehydrogenase [Pseudomonas]MDD2058539.1 NAD(P)-dependent alcohol dehydrogenase [Pseudomonas putida]MDH0640721.1 NAD(P)-dependent alcohol dehydrogenase [Pseudomonas sp. GD03860]
MTICTGFGAVQARAPLTPMRFERRALRADDVAIAIGYCGVCHSDAHQVHNDWNNTVYPCIPGHEIVGKVTAVGSSVSRFKVGDQVAVGCLVDSCQQCTPCTEHQEQLCAKGPTATYNGKDRHSGEITYGGYADQIVVREQFVLRMPAGLDPAQAAPLLCAGITVWNPMRRYGVGKGSKVAVVGLGGLGHMAVKLAAALGAEVTVITSSPGKADDARALGADHVLLSSDSQAMLAASNAFDFILDTIPTRHNVNPYLMLLGREGVMVLVGAIEPLEPIHGGLLMRNNRTLAGSIIGGIQATQDLLDFCAEHQVLPSCETIAIADINNAFERMLANDVKYRFVIDMASLKDVRLE